MKITKRLHLIAHGGISCQQALYPIWINFNNLVAHGMMMMMAMMMNMAMRITMAMASDQKSPIQFFEVPILAAVCFLDL